MKNNVILSICGALIVIACFCLVFSFDKQNSLKTRLFLLVIFIIIFIINSILISFIMKFPLS